MYEILVDFTKDYSQIRHALKDLKHYDKTSLKNVLEGCSNHLSENWGSHNYSQIIFVTDLGGGLGRTSIKNLTYSILAGVESHLLPLPMPSKVSFMCIGNVRDDDDFRQGIDLHQKLLDSTGQNGILYVPLLMSSNVVTEKSICDMFDDMCDNNYKSFDCVLHIGSYSKLESPISLFPAPLPVTIKDDFGQQRSLIFSKRLDICGYIKLVDIMEPGGFPACLSCHLVLPRGEEKHQSNQLESEIKQLFDENSEEDDGPNTAESACFLLHEALMTESMAALVLLADNWYGFLVSNSVNKKSNLILNVLAPGKDAVPWLGDLNKLSFQVDSKVRGFPLKNVVRSYSGSHLSWVNNSSLQYNIHKLYRYIRRMPEKTSHFYKELNEIKTQALMVGFVGVIEALADFFEREAIFLVHKPEACVQLKHAAFELRKNEKAPIERK